MEYGLADLTNTMKALEAKLDGGDLAPFKIKLEFSLLQINTALKVLSGIQTSPADNHNKYLLYKQLETTITDIQTSVQVDNGRDHVKIHPLAKTLAKSAEFLALSKAKPFLIAQQKEWLPYYLEHDLQTSFDSESAENRRKITSLCASIKNITADAKLNSEQKTKKIGEEILKFAESKSSSFALFKPKDPLKSKVMEWLTIHRQALINPLLDTSSKLKPG